MPIINTVLLSLGYGQGSQCCPFRSLKGPTFEIIIFGLGSTKISDIGHQLVE